MTDTPRPTAESLLADALHAAEDPDLDGVSLKQRAKAARMLTASPELAAALSDSARLREALIEARKWALGGSQNGIDEALADSSSMTQAYRERIEGEAISAERVRIEEWFTDAANDEASELLSAYLDTRGSEPE